MKGRRIRRIFQQFVCQIGCQKWMYNNFGFITISSVTEKGFFEKERIHGEIDFHYDKLRGRSVSQRVCFRNYERKLGVIYVVLLSRHVSSIILRCDTSSPLFCSNPIDQFRKSSSARARILRNLDSRFRRA